MQKNANLIVYFIFAKFSVYLQMKFSALIIGGIYYQFLHRDRSSFCGLDFNDPKDIEIMRNTVSQLVKLVFSTLNINKQQ